MSKRKTVNLTVQPSDNLRLAVQVRDEKLAELLRVARRLRRIVRQIRRAK